MLEQSVPTDELGPRRAEAEARRALRPRRRSTPPYARDANLTPRDRAHSRASAPETPESPRKHQGRQRRHRSHPRGLAPQPAPRALRRSALSRHRRSGACSAVIGAVSRMSTATRQSMYGAAAVVSASDPVTNHTTACSPGAEPSCPRRGLGGRTNTSNPATAPPTSMTSPAAPGWDGRFSIA